MKSDGLTNNKKPKPKTLYILGFIVMLVGLISSVWFHFYIGIGLFFGGVGLYLIGMMSRNRWNM